VADRRNSAKPSGLRVAGSMGLGRIVGGFVVLGLPVLVLVLGDVAAGVVAVRPSCRAEAEDGSAVERVAKVVIVAVRAVRTAAAPTTQRRERFPFGVVVDTANHSYAGRTAVDADSQRRPGIAAVAAPNLG
jgi:hypothetical protein